MWQIFAVVKWNVCSAVWWSAVTEYLLHMGDKYLLNVCPNEAVNVTIYLKYMPDFFFSDGIILCVLFTLVDF